MISATAHKSACGVQGSERGCRNAKIIIGNCRGHQHPVYGPPHIPACDFRSSGSSNSSRRLPTCFAQPEVGGYTPADYISFSKDDNKQCHHNAAVIVDAPLDVCYSLWSDWTKLLEFLDLVGQIGLDNSNPHMALFQCFYRFRKLPLMEIVFLLERQEHHPHESYRSISFNSVYGMPLKGQVEFIEQSNGTTAVRFYFTHPVPNLLVQLQIGPFGVETDMMQILRENFIAFRTQAEAAAPADWPKQREQVAARMQKWAEEHPEGLVLQQEQPQQQQQQQQPQQQQTETQQLQEQPPLQQQEPKQLTQKQQAAASASPAQQQEASAAPKRARGRSTASKASTAAADTAAPPATPQDDAATAAAGKKTATRGRKTTRSRSTSTAAAGAGGDGNSGSSSSGGAAQRRSRLSSSAAEAAAPTEGSSSSNGTGTPAGSSSSSTGKGGARRSTTRRSSKRPSTAAQE